MREEGEKSAPAVPWASSGAKNFIPGKALLLSRSGKFWELSLSSAQLPLTHGLPLSHTHTYGDRHGILRSFSPPLVLKNHSHPFAARSGPVPTASLQLAGRTKSAAKGWSGSSCRGSGLARNAWQQTRPDMQRVWFSSLSLLFFFSYCLLFLYLTSFILSFPFHPVSRSLPPSLLLPAHALLCEGIEFISQHWAGHTTTINSLSLSLCNTHTHRHTHTHTHTHTHLSQALNYLVPNEPSQSSLSFCFSQRTFEWKKLEIEKARYATHTRTQTHTHTICAQRDHIPLHTPPGVRVRSHGDLFPQIQKGRNTNLRHNGTQNTSRFTVGPGAWKPAGKWSSSAWLSI